MSLAGHIRIFLRVRPTERPSRGVSLSDDSTTLDVHIQKRDARDYVNNQKEDYKFQFDEILPMKTKQEEVFEKVAKEIVDSVMEGYNGTIFAYGQTGSGKTYTITGGAERYADRGLIPRSISYIFSEMRRKTDANYRVSISYLEIYNDDGYDLLYEDQSARNLHDLPKVIHREDANGNITLSNLSLRRTDTEEDALNLLFIGDTNRVVAETPKHDASTRSHCIFIIQIEAQKLGSDVKTVSKLHLVDLAGSERVGKTNVDGVLLREARFINQSLHYLEQVIVCLQKKSQGEQIFVPYRNSFMTLVLRDSLGGNCKTTMIAAMSCEEGDMDESVSTCRFAQRVACIKNEASKNEQLDPSLIIQRLKSEVAELKAEIKLLKGGEDGRDHLSADELEECRKMVEEYAENRDPYAKLVLSDMLKINECFLHLKRLYNQLKSQGGSTKGGNYKQIDQVSNEEVERLRLLVQQRDNEIAILLSHLNKQKNEMGSLVSFPQPSYSEETKVPDSPPKKVDMSMRIRERNAVENRQSLMAPTNIDVTPEQLQDRNKAFDIFRKSYRKNEAMEENKALLKEKIQRAKDLTVIINGARGRIESIKNEIEQLRKENALQGLVDKNNVPLEHPREEGMRNQLESDKLTYRDGVAELKDLKVEIERIQKLLNASRERMQADFEAWIQVMLTQTRQTPSTTIRDSSVRDSASIRESSVRDSASIRESSIRDPSVNDNLEAFYKARDQIYNRMN
ncbi:unnamed protein product [Blepharisma stoltei]|uniref:Kinesin-like protein n=1 Tax=Blepharisma stoltei TaxID=1481888 RepID=A0AAU9K9G3_9CILI|nr:unnamed protein product [Blepharisma stoltei]